MFPYNTLPKKSPRAHINNPQLYEQSQFASEVGAAIHLAPNANGILRRYNIMAEDFGAVTMSRLVEYDEKGTGTRSVDLTEQNKMWQHPWMLVHRVRLHDKLKQIATGPEGPGKPAKLYLSSKVAAVDTDNATITLEKGDIIQADLVLGADGIYVSLLSLPSGLAEYKYSLRQENMLLDIQSSYSDLGKLHSDS